MWGTKARFGIGAATAAVAALAVAGCSGGGNGGGGGATTAAGGATGQSSATGGGPTALMLVSDVLGKASGAGTVKIQGTVTSATTGIMTMAGEEQYSPSEELSMTMQIQRQSLSEVLIGSTFYLDYPALTAEMGGKQWGRIDLSKAGGTLGSLSTLADSAKSYDPTTQIAAMIASGTVVRIGPETVDGKQATHYQGKLNVTQMLAHGAPGAAGLTAAQLDALRGAMKTAGVTTELVDLWVDSSGLPVEVKYVAQTTAGQISTDMNLTDWGRPVQIGAPPASQVFDLTTQLAKAGASASAAG